MLSYNLYEHCTLVMVITALKAEICSFRFQEISAIGFQKPTVSRTPK